MRLDDNSVLDTMILGNKKKVGDLILKVIAREVSGANVDATIETTEEDFQAEEDKPSETMEGNLMAIEASPKAVEEKDVNNPDRGTLLNLLLLDSSGYLNPLKRKVLLSLRLV